MVRNPFVVCPNHHLGKYIECGVPRKKDTQFFWSIPVIFQNMSKLNEVTED